jgi:hypothetical protein
LRPQTTGELFEDGADDDAAINPYDDLDASLVARGPLVELEEDDSNFQVGGCGGWGAPRAGEEWSGLGEQGGPDRGLTGWAIWGGVVSGGCRPSCREGAAD